MAKIEYNQILPKKTVEMDNDPYLILSSHIAKKDRQKASNNVRMKNLRTGHVIDKTFHQSNILKDADIEKKDVKFLYSSKGEFWFCTPDNPRDRFSLNSDIVGDLNLFVVENSIVEAIVFNDEIMSISIPIKVSLKVKEAPDAVKGNTSSGATKEVVMETGLTIQAPQFINRGDTLKINTENREYSERAEKA